MEYFAGMAFVSRLYGQVYKHIRDDLNAQDVRMRSCDDNYGFAAFVHANKADFIKLLGEGTHHGEWAGPGINSGEGLKSKTFVLFNFWEWPAERQRPPNTVPVPVLYNGPIDLSKITEAVELLKAKGSQLVEGYMAPEGVVVNINGVRYKRVLTPEESPWQRQKDKTKNPKNVVDFNYLCQPMRLEKLLSRDEKYKRGYPESLPQIVQAYIADLVKEDQIPGDEDQVKSIRKAATGQIFKFIKTVMETSQ